MYSDFFVEITEGDPGDIERIKKMVLNDFFCRGDPHIEEKDNSMEIYYRTKDAEAIRHIGCLTEAGKNSTIEISASIEQGGAYTVKNNKGETEEEEYIHPGFFWASYMESMIDHWEKLFKCPDCGKKHHLTMIGTPHGETIPEYGTTYQCHCGHIFDLEAYKTKKIESRNWDYNEGLGMYNTPDAIGNFGHKLLNITGRLEASRTDENAIEYIEALNAVGRDLIRAGRKLTIDQHVEEFLNTGDLRGIEDPETQKLVVAFAKESEKRHQTGMDIFNSLDPNTQHFNELAAERLAVTGKIPRAKELEKEQLFKIIDLANKPKPKKPSQPTGIETPF